MFALKLSFIILLLPFDVFEITSIENTKKTIYDSILYLIAATSFRQDLRGHKRNSWNASKPPVWNQIANVGHFVKHDCIADINNKDSGNNCILFVFMFKVSIHASASFFL